MFGMIVSSFIYLVSVVIPLLVTLETLNIICFTSNSGPKREQGAKNPTISTANTNIRTLVFQLKYWCLYGIAFGVTPINFTNAILNNIPFASILLLGVNGVLTTELLREFTKFIQCQDGKFIFLFNKFNDSNVSWFQWINYATTYDENNIANLFIFGEFTQFWVSLADKSPFGNTQYLEKSFDHLQDYLIELTNTVNQYLHRRKATSDPYNKNTDKNVPRGFRATSTEHTNGATARSSEASSQRKSSESSTKFSEGYDLLEDIFEDSRKKGRF